MMIQFLSLSLLRTSVINLSLKKVHCTKQRYTIKWYLFIQLYDNTLMEAIAVCGQYGRAIDLP